MTMTTSWRRNPVAQAELKHQKHVIDTNHAARIWIILAILLVVPTMIVALFTYLAAFLLPFVPVVRTLYDADGWMMALLMIVNPALYIVVTLMTFSLSAGSIRREKDAQTWDHLLITTIEPSLIVLGKWWASTRMLAGDHLMVVLVRLGMVGWIVLGIHEQDPANIVGLPAEVVLLLVLGLITVIYSALDMALTAALGVLSALLSQGGLITGLVILLVRGGTMIGALVLWVITATILQHGAGSLRWLALTLVAWAIYGLLIGASLAVARTVVVNHARLGG